MKNYINHIVAIAKFLSVFAVLFSAESLLAFNNKGATVIVKTGAYVNVRNIDFINRDDGFVKLEGTAVITANNNIDNRLGEFDCNDDSQIIVDQNFENDDSIIVNDNAVITIKGSIINCGFVTNYNIIEIGE